MLLLGLIGALIAGIYGALHDQVSYSISPEYFTRLKFKQFHWADRGWTPRVFASVVGFLATWWVGMFAGWFMSRAGLDELPRTIRRRVTAQGFGIVLMATVVFGVLGGMIGYFASRGELSSWDGWQERLALRDVPAFVIVAWIHGAGYAGALVGLVGALVYVRTRRKRCGQ